MKQHDPAHLIFSPTDLSKYTGCKHLSLRDRAVAQGILQRPPIQDPYFHLITERGRRFEQDFVEELIRQGHTVADFRDQEQYAVGNRIQQTWEAMQAGADYIVQARLQHQDWDGFADILKKVDRPSKQLPWSYEVIDTKLAMTTKAGSILQLCAYTEMLGKLQGLIPEKMHIVKPGPDFQGFVSETFAYRDYAAYYRRTKEGFSQLISNGQMEEHYPDPVDHCQLCSWWGQCEQKRRDDDHLSFVAGMQRHHIMELEERRVPDLEALAQASIDWKPERGSVHTYQKLQEQAQLQWHRREDGHLKYQLLDFTNDEGLNLLPAPSEGDVFFDIEADRFLEGGGLEYLLGTWAKDEAGKMEYLGRWAWDRAMEKQQFEDLIDWIIERWQKYPDMYIYHFGHYETSALQRLMTRYNTRIQEVNQLLRGQRFINLLSITRQSLLAAVESYSLKELEPYYTFVRNTDLKDAAWSLRAIQRLLEFRAIDDLPAKAQETVEAYNREDCVSTQALRDWLEHIRNTQVEKGKEINRPPVLDGLAGDKMAQAYSRIQQLQAGLQKDLPDDPETWTETQHAQNLLANLLGYFRREDLCYWWEYYRLLKLERNDLIDERKALVGLHWVERRGGTDQCPIHRYRFDDQEATFDPEDQIIDHSERKIGTVADFDLSHNWIDIKKRKDAREYHPDTILVHDHISADSLEKSLLDTAESLLTHGWSTQIVSPVVRQLLFAEKPRVAGHIAGSLMQSGENALTACKRCALGLQESILPIQGPPGCGKTYTGARIILALVKQNKKVGVTALGHKAIDNLLQEVLKAATEANEAVEVVHKHKKKTKASDGHQEVATNKDALAAISDGKVVGGTVWLWSNEKAQNQLDYLIVDEAGQLSLAHVLAAAGSTRNLILLGDPRQLEQPQQASHPEGSDVSALEHLLQGQPTVKADRGIFLDKTYRMHPNICQFTSEMFYENRLESVDKLKRQQLIGPAPYDRAGLFFEPVDHEGNSNTASAEVAQIVKLVHQLCHGQYQWLDSAGKDHDLNRNSLMIIAPYNAQVAALKKALPGMRIGTVDKFQGQQAPVVIYSVTSSSAEEAPRGMRFLYDPSRLNVASSRARCAFILVASPKIFAAECRTPEQMTWANGYCRYFELAKP